MRGYLTSRPYSERLFPLLLAQFLGVFNDNAFKMFAVLAVIGSSRTGYFRDAAFMFAMTVSYVLPFLLLTGPAGAISDGFVIDNAKCLKCNSCLEVCPKKAIKRVPRGQGFNSNNK